MYVSKNTVRRHVNLLLIGGDSKKHNVIIKEFYIWSYTTSWKKKTFLALQTFSTTEILIDCFNPIHDGILPSCSRLWGGGRAKRPPFLKFFKQILQWWNLAVITYLKKTQKIYESSETPLEFRWHQPLLTKNQQLLLYQKIQT